MPCEVCGYRTALLGVATPVPFGLDCWQCDTVVTYRWLPSGASVRPHGLVPVASPTSAGPPCDLGAAAASNPSSPSLADLLGSLEATWAAESASGQRTPSALPPAPRSSTSRYVPPKEAVSDDEGVRPPVGGTAAPVVPTSPFPNGDEISPVVVSDDEGNSVN